MIEHLKLTKIDGPARLEGGVVIGSGCSIGFDGPDEAVILGHNSTIRSHTVIYGGVHIGTDFSSGHGVLIREGTRIGNGCSIGSHSVLEHSVMAGDHVRVHSRSFIPEHSILHDGCWIGPGVILTNSRYPNRPDSKANLEGVIVGKRAVVGAGAVVLPGVAIGAGSLVGAGAVVTRDVRPGARVVGNPAREMTN